MYEAVKKLEVNCKNTQLEIVGALEGDCPVLHVFF